MYPTLSEATTTQTTASTSHFVVGIVVQYIFLLQCQTCGYAIKCCRVDVAAYGRSKGLGVLDVPLCTMSQVSEGHKAMHMHLISPLPSHAYSFIRAQSSLKPGALLPAEGTRIVPLSSVPLGAPLTFTCLIVDFPVDTLLRFTVNFGSSSHLLSLAQYLYSDLEMLIGRHVRASPQHIFFRACI